MGLTLSSSIAAAHSGLMCLFSSPSQVNNPDTSDQKPETASLASNLSMSEESKYHVLCTMGVVFL